jgi:hypothetical protein
MLFMPAWNRRPLLVAAGTVLIAAGLAAIVVPGAAGAAGPPTPFTQCSAVGQSPSCKVLLVVNADDTVSVYDDPSVGDYDGGDDTLVGIVNNSNKPVTAVTVTGPGSYLAGFDSDGLCSFISCSWSHPTGYEGPLNTFTTEPSNFDVAEVDFGGSGLTVGSSSYFSLEGTLTAAQLTARKGTLNRAVELADHAQEPLVAVNPTDSNDIVVGFNHITSAGPRCGYRVSHDGGSTWGTVADLPLPNTPGVSTSFGDPGLAFNSSGRLFFSCLAGYDDDQAGPDGTALALYTSVSTNGGDSFSAPTLVVRGSKASTKTGAIVVQPDQEQLAGSPTGSQAYMCYALETTSPGGPDNWAILLKRLDTFGKPAATGSVIAGLHESEALSCTVGVAASGRVWVGWWNAGASQAEVSFSDNAATATGSISFTGHHILGPKSGAVDSEATLQTGRHVFVRPSPVAGDNRVVAVWENDTVATHDMDSASFDGTSWTTATQLFHDVYQPALAWGADGTLTVGLYQDSSSTPEWGQSLTYSVGTLSVPVNLASLRAVAPNPSSARRDNPQVLQPFGRFGDYTSVAEAGGLTSAAWSDTSTGSQTVWFSH